MCIGAQWAEQDFDKKLTSWMRPSKPERAFLRGTECKFAEILGNGAGQKNIKNWDKNLDFYKKETFYDL